MISLLLRKMERKENILNGNFLLIRHCQLQINVTLTANFGKVIFLLHHKLKTALKWVTLALKPRM